MMNKCFETIRKMRRQFGWDKTDTKEKLVLYLLEEANELKESLSLTETDFKSELADVLMYALALCMDEGYDVDELIEAKANEVMKREY